MYVMKKLFQNVYFCDLELGGILKP